MHIILIFPGSTLDDGMKNCSKNIHSHINAASTEPCFSYLPKTREDDQSQSKKFQHKPLDDK
jgi:hypothetical protein